MLARGAGSQFPVEPGWRCKSKNFFSVRTRSVHVLLHRNISNFIYSFNFKNLPYFVFQLFFIFSTVLYCVKKEKVCVRETKIITFAGNNNQPTFTPFLNFRYFRIKITSGLTVSSYEREPIKFWQKHSEATLDKFMVAVIVGFSEELSQLISKRWKSLNDSIDQSLAHVTANCMQIDNKHNWWCIRCQRSELLHTNWIPFYSCIRVSRYILHNNISPEKIRNSIIQTFDWTLWIVVESFHYLNAQRVKYVRRSRPS